MTNPSEVVRALAHKIRVDWISTVSNIHAENIEARISREIEQALAEARRGGVDAEREACAQIAEEAGVAEFEEGAFRIAAAIRARKGAEK